jgi:hypothetical protein
MLKRFYTLPFVIGTFILGAGCAQHLETKIQKKNIAQPIVINAVDNFKRIEKSDQRPYAPAYIDTNTQSLAIDAVHYKDVFSSASYQYLGKSGIFKVELTALTELDGESQYQLSVNKNAYTLKTNPSTSVDYAPFVHQWNNVQINKGDILQVAFSSTTNGLIPEGDITAFSRGRWTKVTLICIENCE